MYYININEILTKNVHNLRFVILTMHSIHVIVQLMQNLYLMNTSLTEHILDGPVGVHYIEILLYFAVTSEEVDPLFKS